MTQASVVTTTDSITQSREINRLFWKPDPFKAVWLGVILPGGGQIYNRSYWKLPIVYGGLMGCIYAITYMFLIRRHIEIFTSTSKIQQYLMIQTKPILLFCQRGIL